MTSRRDETWRDLVVGGDRALVKRLGSATMAFAAGPAIGEPDRTHRLSMICSAQPDDPRSISHCRQVHGTTVHRIEGESVAIEMVGDGDALVTDQPGHGVLIWTADCVPVLLATRGVVAAVHSGWRGCAADVVGATVSLLIEDYGINPRDLHSAIGPAVCGRCYRVGSEVPTALGAFGLDEHRWLAGDHVDLRGFLTARFEALGVPAEQIETVGGCTVESPDLASFRRDGAAAGRQWSMVYLNR